MGFVIAVDGPAASGKGTIAGRLALVYGLPYLDTGLLYRAVGKDAAFFARPVETLADGSQRVDTDSAEFRSAAIVLSVALDKSKLDDPGLRSNAAGELASRVAVIPQVREALLEFQRLFAGQPGGAVLDGRDIGTVIVPDASAKLFVTARAEVRAERRWRQLTGQGETVALADVLADIQRRDARDSERASAPLAQATDAALLDTSDLSISDADEVARRLVEAARARWELSQSG